MGLLASIALIVLGILASPQILVSRRPDAREFLDKLLPFQGVIGVIACVWGVIIAIQALTVLGRAGLFAWLIWAATGLVMATLGFLLGYALIKQYALSQNASVDAQGEAARARLSSYQPTLAMVAVALGILGVFMWLLRF